jgi:hypothetical protein
VPRVDRDEFANIGALVSCPSCDFLAASIEIDENRLRALYSNLDLDTVRTHAGSIPLICQGGPDAGPIGQLSKRERFHWLVAPRSTMIQMSPVHTGRCKDPAGVLEHLMKTMVR